MSRINLAIVLVASALAAARTDREQTLVSCTPEEREALDRADDARRRQEAESRARAQARADADAAPFREARRLRNAAKLAAGHWRPS